ncbi:MAG: transketolase C-terminal domain-containing protein [Armatimonadota bacterium]|nr:transketolase [bacterium]
MRDTFVARLMQLAQEDPSIMLITGDLGFGVLTKFQEKFPKRYINAGIAEQNMTGLATGLAMVGKTVFTYSIGNFPILRCLEQIRNDACYHGANVKIVSVGGGFSYGSLGISHHATEDIGIMRSLPDITVVVPSDKWEAGEVVEELIKTPGACYLRLDKSSAPDSHAPGERFELGRARVVRAGSDITIIACGGILGEAIKAADALAEAGISCRVVSMHTIKPLDLAAIADACNTTGGIITVEENTVDGGLGGAVAEACLEMGLNPGVFHRIGLRAGFSCIVGSQDYLRARYEMDAAAITKSIKNRVLGGLSRI